eukprot:g8369.t1
MATLTETSRKDQPHVSSTVVSPRAIYLSKATLQGRRPHQEDRIFCCNLIKDSYSEFKVSCLNKCSRLSLFAVCDGHAGAKAAQYCCDNLISTFWQAASTICALPGIIDLNNLDLLKPKLKSILELMVDLLDKSYLLRAKRTKEKDGSCITAVLMLNNHAFFVNVGDCRSMRVNNGTITQITRDHQPGLYKQEDKRVLDAGGKISDSRHNKRVLAKGMKMAITRAIGDRLLKPSIIISKPDIFYVGVSQDLKFFILCSDGVTGRLTPRDIHDVLRKNNATNNIKCVNKEQHNVNSNKNSKVCINYAKEIVDFSYKKGSLDNITALVLEFV